MKALLALFAALTGVASGLQPGINGSLGKVIGPLQAGLVSFAVSATIMVIGGLASGRLGVPGRDQLMAAPWWAWTSGALGLMVILGQLYIAEPLGSAVFMTINVTLAMLVSLALDHYGLLGFKEHSINAGRIAGAVLIIGGLGLIARF